MTMANHIAAINALVEQYNAAMQADVIDARRLNDIEQQLKDASAEAKKDRKIEVYIELEKAANPMLEACRMYSFEFPSYTLVKADGVVTGAEAAYKTATISPVEFGSRLIKAAESKSCPFERSGVCEHGHAWEYRAEKLAYLLTYRTIRNLGGSPAEIDEFKKSYAIRDLAAREKMGETPTSTSQIVKCLQSIIDLMVFVLNDKGTNAVKANGKDAEYLLSIFEKAGRGAGVVEVLKGSRIKDYIFTVCHMIVTGKAYAVKYAKKKDGAQNDLARKPVEVSPKSKKVSSSSDKKASEPSAKKVSASEPKPACADVPADTMEVSRSEQISA